MLFPLTLLLISLVCSSASLMYYAAHNYSVNNEQNYSESNLVQSYSTEVAVTTFSSSNSTSGGSLERDLPVTFGHYVIFTTYLLVAFGTIGAMIVSCICCKEKPENILFEKHDKTNFV